MSWLQAVALLAALGAGLIGGVFFAFSNCVMPALRGLAVHSAVAAMQSINRTVLNGLFLGVLFGTGLLCLPLAVLSGMGATGRGGWLLMAGSALYLLGPLGATLARNVPLNDRLVAVDPHADRAADHWRAYHQPWTSWNHVRTAAALAASAAFSAAATLL